MATFMNSVPHCNSRCQKSLNIYYIKLSIAEKKTPCQPESRHITLHAKHNSCPERMTVIGVVGLAISIGMGSAIGIIIVSGMEE